MNTPDILAATLPIVEILEQLSVPYHIGGSVASSIYGLPRLTIDVDLVADLKLEHVHPLVRYFEIDYYIDADAVRDAIKRKGSFNAIHLTSMLKVDVFIPKSRLFDQEELHRVQLQTLVEGTRPFYVASPEGTILNKLEWYRMGMALEGLQLGQYRLMRLLGSGGMGEVYLAEDARINQQVAIKVARAEASSYPNSETAKDAIRLFQREAKAIARLDHPRILPLFGYGEDIVNGMTLTCIIMPYRPEGSFADWLQQRSESQLLPAQDIAYFIEQAADALQYAHDNQIVHQDVKPSNFLIRTNKQKPHLPDLLLADFGIARLSSATASVSHSIRGTPTYMAPEQWSSEPVPATDQYALAVMTYELLTGRPPFQGPPMRMMYLHTNTPPQPPSAVNPSILKEVDTVLLTALAKKPEERFLSIAAFVRALEQAAQYTDVSTVVGTPNIASTREVRATLAISKREAQNGTNRTLNLAGGRQVTASVPAGAYDGQIIRPNDASVGTLIITLSVKETEPTFLPSTPSQSFDKTIPSSNPGIPAESVPPAKRNSNNSPTEVVFTNAKVWTF